MCNMHFGKKQNPVRQDVGLLMPSSAVQGVGLRPSRHAHYVGVLISALSGEHLFADKTLARVVT